MKIIQNWLNRSRRHKSFFNSISCLNILTSLQIKKCGYVEAAQNLYDWIKNMYYNEGYLSLLQLSYKLLSMNTSFWIYNIWIFLFSMNKKRRSGLWIIQYIIKKNIRTVIFFQTWNIWSVFRIFFFFKYQWYFIHIIN